MVWGRVKAIFFQMDIQLFQYHLLEIPPFHNWITLATLLNICLA